MQHQINIPLILMDSNICIYYLDKLYLQIFHFFYDVEDKVFYIEIHTQLQLICS